MIQAAAQTIGNFLNYKTQTTGLQDTITRMKPEETRGGVVMGEEEAEARNVLNRFLGPQVGLQGNAASSIITSAPITIQPPPTTITEVVDVVTPPSSYEHHHHPITVNVLARIWNPHTLRLLLEQSSDYEERRLIRSRLEQVMAEKEACSEYVEKRFEESDAGSTVQGESLLLPLLQGILPPNELEQTADSGTESGEDLRSGLIIEVQHALEKLSACLSNESADITNERRDSLLQLVGRLQANLTVPSAGPSSSSSSGGNRGERRLSQGRFAKRRQRHNRHTVGVSSEELEDARRLMEEFALHDLVATSSNPLQKQNSESCVPKTTTASSAFRPVKFQPNIVKNILPKPYPSSSTSSTSQSSSTVDTPTNSNDFELVYPSADKSDDIAYFCNTTMLPPPDLITKDVKIIDRESETDEDSTLKQESYATLPKINNQLKEGDTVVLFDQSIYPPAMASNSNQAMKQNYNTITSNNNNESHIYYQPPTQSQSQQQIDNNYHHHNNVYPQQNNTHVDVFQANQHEAVKTSSTQQQQAKEILLQTNPIYTNPLSYRSNSQDDSNRNNNNNRFSKKLRMKRANTIDIPKPSNYYHFQDDDEMSDGEMTEPEMTKRSNYLALRGPIRVGGGKQHHNPTIVPTFEPKTDSDRKFLAFINKQNANSGVSNKISLWDKAVTSQQAPTVVGHHHNNNWQHKFGNVKTKFEPASNSSEQALKNSARSFWKNADVEARTCNTNTTTTNNNNQTPKITTRQNAKNLQQMYEQKTQTTNNPTNNDTKYTNNTHFQKLHNKFDNGNEGNHIVTGSLKVDTKSYKFVPVNKFSHNPQSPFKPIQPKAKPENLSLQRHHTIHTPEFLYSPKSNDSNCSPVHHTPWSNNKFGERRVLNIAASKFEQPVNEPVKNKPARKMSSEKTLLQNFAATTRIQQPPPPSLPTENGHVRKLTTQYMPPAKMVDMPQQPHLHQSAFATVPQSQPKQSVDHQNNYYKYYQHEDDNSYDALSPELNSASSNDLLDDYYHNDLDELPPSFHTTDPIVQKLHNKMPQQQQQQQQQPQPQQQRQYHEVYEQPAHVYYNNVHPVAPQQQQYYSVQTEVVTNPPKHIDRQMSQESVHEYHAVSSKVKGGPVSQQAVTVQQNQPKNRNEHEMDAMLKNTLLERRSPRFTSATGTGSSPKFTLNDKPVNLESLEITDQGETIVTSKFQIPAWQNCDSIMSKPSPRASPNARTVMKSKSTHMLALPKQFEAGMSRDEMVVKKKTMEAYFSTTGGGAKSPPQQQQLQQQQQHNSSVIARRAKCHNVNRIKTSEKTQFASEKFETTKTMFSDEPLTKTQGTRVMSTTTTTTTTTQQVTRKPISPFAKFRQLDKQNSFNSSFNTPPSTPSTPKTPTSGGPLFKFTDPNLTRSASTIKERLLQWCQMKTHKYENIKLDNFSTSWADGLAFCALIHHFLPDAFDYDKLTPQNRRYNFTLAFQVADEKADIAPLLDVDDMVATRRPDWKCVFTYVQSIYRRFKDDDN